MGDRITAATVRITLFGGEERVTSDLSGLLQLLADATSGGTAVQTIELFGKARDGAEHRAMLEPVGVFKEQAPVGFQSLVLDRTLGDILIQAGIASTEQIRSAVEEQRKSSLKERLGEVIVRMGIATPEQVRNALLEQMGAPGHK